MRRAAVLICVLAFGGAVAWLLLDPVAPPEQTPLGSDDGGTREISGTSPLLGGRKAPPQGVKEAAAPPPDPEQAVGPYEFDVASAEDDVPLGGVEIEALADDEATERIGTTGEDGRLRVEDGGGPSLLFRATKEGFLPYRSVIRAGGMARFTMQPGIAIGGRVTRAVGGTPVPYAILRVWDVDSERQIAETSTSEEGRFTIPAVRPNHPFLMVVQVEGFCPHRQTENFDVSVKDVEVVVGEGGVLIGRVADPTGRPFGDHEVHLIEAHRPQPHKRRPETRAKDDWPRLAEAIMAKTRTNEKGDYRFEGVALSTPLQAVVQIAPRYEARSRAVRFQEAAQRLEAPIKVAEAASLRLRIEDEGGNPVRDATVFVVAGHDRWVVERGDRQPDGSILMDGVAPVVVGLRATRRDSPGPIEVSDPLRLRPGREETLIAVFGRGRALTGRVTDKRGHPIWRATVSWSAGREGQKEHAATTTDSHGEFRLRDLAQPAGDVTINARDVPISRLGYEKKVVEAIKPGKALKIVLKDGTQLRGSFPQLEQGTPLYAALLPGSAGDSGTLDLDAQKRFKRRGPPADAGARIYFYARRYPPIQLNLLPLRSEEDRDLGPLYFKATNPFKGQVLDAHGKPIRGAKVAVTDRALRRSVRTDRDGLFQFANLPEPGVSIRVDAPLYPPNRAYLAASSQHRRATFRLAQKGRLQLAVIGRDKRKANKAGVWIYKASEKVPQQMPRKPHHVTNAKGLLSLALTPGRYRVASIIRNRGEAGDIEVTIQAGQVAKPTLKLERFWTWYNRQREAQRRAARKR